MAKSVNVVFYRANRTIDEGNWIKNDQLWPALAQALNNTQNAWPGPVIISSYGRDYLVESRKIGVARQFTISAVRADTLPLILRAGSTAGSPLDIDDRDRLLEPTYLNFFSQRVVALVGTSQTPSARTCANVLSRMSELALSFDPIPRADIAQLLQDGRAITSLDLSVASGNVDVATKGQDAVSAASNAMESVGSVSRVRMVLSADTDEEQRGLLKRVQNMFKRGQLDPASRASVRLITTDGETRLIDLFETDIATSISVDASRSLRFLLPETASGAAISAHKEMKDQLNEALELAVD